MPRLAPISRLLLCAVILVLVGCSGGKSESKPTWNEDDRLAAAAFGSREEFDRLLRAALDESNRITHEETVQLAVGVNMTVTARVLNAAHDADTTATASMQPEIPEPLGERWLTLPAAPSALAVTNSGAILYGLGGALMRCDAPGTAHQVLPLDLTALQFDATGQRLLIQSRDRVGIAGEDDVASIQWIAEHPPGRAFWGETEGTLFFVQEKVNFAATEKYRVDLGTAVLDLATGTTGESAWSPSRRYSAVGTLPATGMTWGQLITHYQTRALPGPIYLLDRGTPIAPLTRTDVAADMQPTADRQQNLFWIRTYRHDSNSGRAMTRNLRAEPEEVLQLTGVPTWLIAAAHDGPHAAVCISTQPGRFELWRIDKSSLDAEQSRCAEFILADEQVRGGARALVDDLREAFIRVNPGGGTKTGDFGIELAEVPKPDEIERMGDALDDALRRQYGIEMEPGMSGLRQLDELFRTCGAYLREEPSLLLALASHVARAVGGSATWYLEGAQPTLDIDYQKPVYTDDISFTAVSVFGICRDRISGDLSLAATVESITSAHVPPYFLVENLRYETLDGLQQQELRRAGLDRDLSNADIKALLDRSRPDNNIVTNAILRAARLRSDKELALIAAMKLARQNPASGKVLKLLGDTLSDAYLTREALDAYRQAAQLCPLDPEIRFVYADALVTRDELAEAEIEYLRVARTDSTKLFDDDIPARLLMIEELRSKAAK